MLNIERRKLDVNLQVYQDKSFEEEDLTNTPQV